MANIDGKLEGFPFKLSLTEVNSLEGKKIFLSYIYIIEINGKKGIYYPNFSRPSSEKTPNEFYFDHVFE